MGVYFFSEDAAVSADGSAVTFTLPAVVPPEFYREPMYVYVYSSGPYVICRGQGMTAGEPSGTAAST